jgi:hypothetical protein
MISGGPPAKVIRHSDGSTSKMEGYEMALIESINAMPPLKRLEILDFDIDDMILALEELKNRQFELCDKNLRYRHWRFREDTESKIYIDDDMMIDFFGLDIKKRAFYKRLKNGTADIKKVVEINNLIAKELVR